MPTVTLFIPGWRPAPLNQLLGHWSRAHRLKKADRDTVGKARIALGVPQATGKRRVSLRVVLAPRWRTRDPDSMWKSLLDSLVHAGLLVGDDPNGVVIGTVEQKRGDKPGTEITLEDLP